MLLQSHKLGRLVLFAALTTFARGAATAEGPSRDRVVQTPQLSSPGRGSLAGALGAKQWGPGDVSRGTFSLPFPGQLPEGRGALPLAVLPTYSPEGALSEWGLGWGNSLAITRFRLIGDVGYDDDDLLSSPWGRLARGDDGAWYPADLKTYVRVEATPQGWMATTQDGTRFTFSQDVSIVGPRGTFAWYVTQAEELGGHHSQFDYDTGADGRPYLRQVTYGRKRAVAQRATLSYESVQRPTTRWDAGVPITLDRRVKQVAVDVQQAGSGTWQRRFAYDVTYESDTAGAAFFLHKVTKVYASGQQEPPVVFEHARWTADFWAAEARPSHKLQAYVDLAPEHPWAGSLDPRHATFFDIDGDGRTDVETSYDHSVLVQTDSGWVKQSLPPAAKAHTQCRPPEGSIHLARNLARMAPGIPDSHVFNVTGINPTQAQLTICDRPGQLLFQTVVDGAWRLGPNTRLVDVNRDHAPDLVWIDRGMYRILPNESTKTDFAFGNQRTGRLTPEVRPQASWVQDVNGDGIPDIVVLMPTGLLAWAGKGNFEFAEQGTLLKLEGVFGAFSLKPNDEIYFVDANHDGLADLLVLAEGRRPTLFVNNGTSFQQVDTPAFEALRRQGLGAITFGQFSESGDIELAMSLQGRAHTLALDTPQTSLLTTVNDGKGTRWHLSYGRAPAQAGVRHRTPILTAVEALSSGKEPEASAFVHSQAVVHSQTEQVVGFAHVVMTRGPLREERDFHHDNDTAGLPLRSLQLDVKYPQLQQENVQRYAQRVFRGLPFQQQVESTDTLHDTQHGQAIRRSEQASAWANPWCPLKKTRTSIRGTWEQESTLADVEQLRHVPHCLITREIQRGSHTDSGLDFNYAVEVKRNAFGDVTEVALPDALVLQRLEYDAQRRIVRSEVPGAGATKLAYDVESGLLASVTSPDGVQTAAEARDPLSDALVALTADHGDGHAYRRGFRFDGYERLAASWDNLGNSSPTRPLEALTYRYAGSNGPGLLHSSIRFTDSAVQERLELTTGDGVNLASAVRHGQRWNLSGWSRGSSMQGLTTAYRGKSLESEGPVGATGLESAEAAAAAFASYSPIFDGSLALATTHGDALGYLQSAERWVQHNVQARESSTYAIRDDALHIETRDAQGRATRTILDIDRKPLSTYDGKQETRMSFDAAGRLRRVVLPDGTQHTLQYDAQGRISTLVHDGIAGVAFRYKDGTELLEMAHFSDRNGQSVRSVRYVYDDVGRKTEVIHAERDGRQERIQFYYDGGTPDGTHLPGQRGFLTGVQGAGFAKTFEYDARGALRRKWVDVTGWRSIDQTFTYFADGSARGATTRVLHAGRVASQIDTETELDSDGRPRAFLLNGERLYSLEYDERGNVAAILSANDTSLAFSRDGTTRSVSGAAASNPNWPGEAFFAWERDDSNHIVKETLSLGGSQHTRTYAYDLRGFLSAWHGAEDSQGYAYDKNGVPIVGSGADTAVDEEGRLVRQGDRSFVYNAAGQLATVRPPDRVVSYLYDESGQRLAKMVNGTHVEAYVDGDVLTAQHHLRPIEGHGWLIGMLVDGVLTPILADPRGSTLVDSTGGKVWTSPFGAVPRDVPATEQLYAKHRFDPDSGTFRMGLRDYEPTLGRFTTPDPLLLLEPASCAADPLQCNLFAYGLNDPLQYADPSGLVAEDIWGRCSAGGDYETVYRNWGTHHGRSETPQAWHLRSYERGGVESAMVQPDLLLWGASTALQLTKSLAVAAHSMLSARLYAVGMSEQALNYMVGQHVRVHGFEGVRAASEFLIERGIAKSKRVEILQSFIEGTIKFELADASTFGSRFWGGGANQVGAYLFPAFGNMINRQGLAVPYQFGNTFRYLWQAQIAEGTPILRGITANQFKYGPQWMGGAEQIFVLDARLPGVLR